MVAALNTRISSARRLRPVRRPWRLIVLALLAALVLAPAGEAHVSISPDSAIALEERVYVLLVENDRHDTTVRTVTLTIPADAAFGAEAKPGWRTTRTEKTISWRGGNIPPDLFATFTISGTAVRPGTLILRVREGYANGEAAAYAARLYVSRTAQQDPVPGEDEGARTLGKFALGIALFAAALSLLLGFRALVERIVRSTDDPS